MRYKEKKGERRGREKKLIIPLQRFLILLPEIYVFNRINYYIMYLV